ncbi:HECT domain-containing protein [Forsythia ovata]|uniref:HECT-type E3 ubiquitin transferase n=1 Tax=Forsythia ovata TaxID=205694 RepID=A0ABD1X9A4_9LAMI
MFICFQDERPSAECPICNGHEKHVQGQFPHLMFPPRVVHAPPGVPLFLQAYPVQGMPYYHTHVELVFLSATSISNWHALLSFVNCYPLPLMVAFSYTCVKLTRYESNPDIVLLALRAMIYLCDVNPRSSSFLVRHDVVPVLCQRLMAIEYLDVADQAMFAYGFEILLTLIVDIEPDAQVMRATNEINSVEQVSNSSDMLDELCKYGLVQQVLSLIELKSQTTLHQNISGMLIFHTYLNHDLQSPTSSQGFDKITCQREQDAQLTSDKEAFLMD